MEERLALKEAKKEFYRTYGEDSYASPYLIRKMKNNIAL